MCSVLKLCYPDFHSRIKTQTRPEMMCPMIVYIQATLKFFTSMVNLAD